jgi:hypothetical protein
MKGISHMGDDYKDSQQEPESDSALQTPQPDQAHPPVSETNRPDDAAPDSPPVQVDVNTQDATVNVDNPVAPAVDGDASSD